MPRWTPSLPKHLPFSSCEPVCAGVSQPVWRRLLIPEQSTIAQLHHVMQLAMGWNDEHLHRFDGGYIRWPGTAVGRTAG